MAKSKEINPEEARYNYLGFEVLPGKIKDFWSTEEEKKKYLKKIKDLRGKPHSIERESSIINSSLLSKVDVVIISIASLLMVASLFLPYYRFEAFGKGVGGLAISYIFNLGYTGSFVAWGGIILKLILTLSVFLIIFSPLIGLVNLLALNSGRDKQNYFIRLKSLSKLNIFAIALYLILLILIIAEEPNIVALASFSMWLNIAAHILGMIPAMEL